MNVLRVRVEEPPQLAEERQQSTTPRRTDEQRKELKAAEQKALREGVRVGRRRDDRLEAQVALVAPEPAPVARRVVLLVAAHALLARARADERRRLERDALVAAEGAAPPAAEAARVLVRRLARARRLFGLL